MKRALFVVLAGVAAVWFSYPEWVDLVATERSVAKLKELGTFGDAFGSLNALFSGLAFAGVAISLHVQYQQIKATQADVADQRRRLAAQAFESVFFQMLSLFSANTLALALKSTSGPHHRGREIFSELYARWKNRSHVTDLDIKEPSGISTAQHFLCFHHCYSHVLDLHFGLLCELLRYVDNGDPKRREEYGRLVKAHLSSFECALLLYFAKSDVAPSGLAQYVEEFALLERIPDLPEIEYADILRFDRKAFGSNTTCYETAHAANTAA